MHKVATWTKYLINTLILLFIITGIVRIAFLDTPPIIAVDHRPLYFGSEMLKDGLNHTTTHSL